MKSRRLDRLRAVAGLCHDMMAQFSSRARMRVRVNGSSSAITALSASIGAITPNSHGSRATALYQHRRTGVALLRPHLGEV